MADREVVSRGIVAIDPRERSGDVRRHLPAGALQRRQLQTAAHSDDVGVEGDDELRGRHARPDAEIERISTNHPAQE